jgi:hypothetical protein
MGLIGSIFCTPTKVRVGQSTLIEVKAPDGPSYDGNELVHVSINGRPGAKQYVQQAPPPGARSPRGWSTSGGPACCGVILALRNSGPRRGCPCPRR